MKLTKKEDYAFFLMSKLAQNFSKGYMSLGEVSEEYGISSYFLKQIAIPLIKSKLIISKEGIGGGYELSKPPEKINLYEIFKALNKLPELTDCSRKTEKCNCERLNKCTPSKVWRKLNKLITEELENTKLSQLV